MIATQIARIIADFILFLDINEDETIDADGAVEMMEWLGSRLDALDKRFLRELVDAFAAIAPEYSGESQKLVRDIPYGFYLEEALAADDPVRLAELEALRDARD
ncbi:hypothetical protein PX699_25055 [Sphingobium sp. H39-3-25]|uniref:hypothetical protein n=1 Tax=Sphingobium arseniciresistens TaxID=3030834 RepID=UPI0023B94FF8|nr:hypothetical protein [Sphingobium arseniciresistens]